MSEPFDPNARSVLVAVTMFGPQFDHNFRFAVDTAATVTSIRTDHLRGLGYDLSRPIRQTRIRSATGTALVPVFRVSRIEALGQTRTDFLVAAHDLPLGVEADGLLGLDFFRGLS
jgi:predicted aspartyl protease